MIYVYFTVVKIANKIIPFGNISRNIAHLFPSFQGGDLILKYLNK